MSCEGKEAVDNVREVRWCDHVRINPLGLIGGPLMVSISGSAVLVFEESILKVVCPRCLDRATGAASQLGKC